MPHGNGASFVSDQPDTSYYRVAGQRPADARYPERRPADSRYSDPRYVEPGYPDPRNPAARPDRGYPSQHAYRDASADQPAYPRRSRRAPERGLPSWLALLLLIGIAGISGLIDSLSGSSIRGVFNYGLVVASLVAILAVKRSGMFPIVVAPPLVYFVASAGLLYIRTGGLHDRGKLIDAATNWIVYGFPAIAGATAVVLVVAGIRLVKRR
jgi:hypothetical protein